MGCPGHCVGEPPGNLLAQPDVRTGTAGRCGVVLEDLQAVTPVDVGEPIPIGHCGVDVGAVELDPGGATTAAHLIFCVEEPGGRHIDGWNDTDRGWLGRRGRDVPGEAVSGEEREQDRVRDEFGCHARTVSWSASQDGHNGLQFVYTTPARSSRPESRDSL